MPIARQRPHKSRHLFAILMLLAGFGLSAGITFALPSNNFGVGREPAQLAPEGASTPGVSATPGTGTATVTAIPTATPGCSPAWNWVPSPNVGASGDELNGILFEKVFVSCL